ncbi:MAG: flagellar biosynthesis regulator FlaF [Pseudomonadota bacterium]
MTPATTAQNAYSSAARTTGTPRAIEYKVFSQVTAALMRAEKNKDKDKTNFITALSKNLQLWTVLGADAANENNQLTDTLRGQVFYLFEFTRDHTNKILSGQSDLSAAPLIDINNAIISGLRSTAKEEEVL